MENAYAPTAQGHPRNARDSVAALEFLLRFTSLLTVCTLRSAGVAVPQVHRSPGFGYWVDVLRELSGATGVATVNGATATRMQETVRTLLRLHDDGPGKEVPFATYKTLRDHLSHSGPVVPGLEKQVDALVRKFWDVMADCLSVARVEFERDGPERHPVLTSGHDRVHLFPFFYVTKDDAWQVFSAFNHKKPSYICFGNSERSLVYPSSKETGTQLDILLRKRGKKDFQRNAFRDSVIKDLEAFKEKGSDLVAHYPTAERNDQEIGGFVIHWSQAVSAGTEGRHDHFRIGQDTRWEWRAEDGKWVSYSTFLRTIANLPVAARRLHWNLKDLEDRLTQDEKEQLGWECEVKLRPAMVTLRGSAHRGDARPMRFEQLIDGLDNEVGAEHEQTLLYFVNGEAGIGKTRAMLAAARERAAELATKTDPATIDRPLFLYLRSNGRVLESLDEAVNNATSETRNLPDPVVKVLCRNGVVALLIDGFDELLGAGFQDAISALSPWLKELDGRGALIVSARSSYYENQFRESLEKAEEVGEKVRHSVAQMEKWSHQEVHQFLTENGVPEAEIKKIRQEDWSLLQLPFFARSFIEMVNKGSYTPHGSSNLMEVLVDSYLTREEEKLEFGEEAERAILSRRQIGEVFEYVVDFMVGNKEREAGLDELELSAAMVLGTEVDEQENKTHAHLRNRLQVLCGIEVAGASKDRNGRRFRFQHELFFDHFLAGLAIGYVNRGEIQSFHRLMRTVEWRSATTGRLAREIGPDELSAALSGFTPETESSGSDKSSELATRNLGSLWAAIIHTTGRMPEVGIRDVTFTDPIDLSRAPDLKSKFVGCSLSALTLPPGSDWGLSLEDTTVRTLTTARDCTDLSRLQGVRHRDLIEFHVSGRAICYRRPEILESLRKLQAGIVDAEADEAGVPPAVEVANHFLKNIAARMAGPLTLNAGNFLPDDQRLDWVRDYEGDWKPFVDTLLATELASSKSFSASGKRKVRIRLRVGAKGILDENSEDPRIQEFWRRRRAS
ncbi:NACHT domain-containing protein [Streptomyces flaveolus]|uniref:NACHT domain-containing protein n=1 Tax=Streptomyces flaveolus TaxID=67297 RepID=UPI0037FD459C